MMKLKEWTLSRLVGLLNSEEPRYCFSMVSACRGKEEGVDYSQSDMDELRHRNNVNTKDLKNQIKANRFGYVEMKGGYVEEGNGGVIETSFMIFAREDREEELFNFSVEMCGLYNQDSVLFVDSKNHYGKYIDRNGEDTHILDEKNKFDFDQKSLSKYFSVIAGKKNSNRFQIISLDEHFELASNLEMMGYSSNRRMVNSKRLTDSQYREFFENYFRNHPLEK